MNRSRRTRWRRKEPFDLGFGHVVSDASQHRLINRDGTFNVRRTGLNFFTSLSAYHALIIMPWWRFLFIAAFAYLASNVVFAAVYLALGAGALHGNAEMAGLGEFARAFFFSVQTLSTIGYGHITPTGLAANFIVTLETFTGLFGVALFTGLAFARFSRPQAKILFSRQAIIAPYQETTGFMFRIVNGRSNHLIELRAQVIFSRMEGPGHKRRRRFYELPLERQKVVFFPLSWTIVHPIDEQSPLRGISAAAMKESQAEFLILLTGLDETFSHTVHARTSYKPDEIRYGVRFQRLIEQQEGGPLSIDISRLDAIEESSTTPEEAAPERR